MNGAEVATRSTATPLRPDHRLVVERVELLGGDRVVNMSSGLNIVQGDITTGKTTFVRMVKSLLSTVSSALPPEAAGVRALKGSVQLRSSDWLVYRPLVTTADAPVEVAEQDDDDDEPTAIRLPATGAEGSYSRFLLDQLGLPAVVVPEGSSTTASRMNPVTMSDWLNYCVITGDELDSEVFGSRDPFRDRKRRIVFELIYGYYDTELSEMTAESRSLELRLSALDQEDIVIGRFLAGTPFQDPASLAGELALRKDELARLEQAELQLASSSHGVGAEAVGKVRTTLLDMRASRDAVAARQRSLNTQLSDLDELARQLRSQSARLTRAIVADEWLVDFDFLVCPRCGNDVQPGAAATDICYLCHQHERPGTSQDVLLAEQSRVVAQISETEELLVLRRNEALQAAGELVALDTKLSSAGSELDRVTSAFVSDQASVLQKRARMQSRLETEIEKLVEYDALLSKRESRATERAALENQLAALRLKIDQRRNSAHRADDNKEALEQKFFEYLDRLRIPQLAETLTVNINAKTYLPEVSTRTFDELSSQGLKTLVNVAHALAHHTVAIDRELPLPGLLILDGLSANAGHKGFDQARVDDLYKLVVEVADEYSDSLQLIVVDNDLPPSMAETLERHSVLKLSQNDRLIRVGATVSSPTPHAVSDGGTQG